MTRAPMAWLLAWMLAAPAQAALEARQLPLPGQAEPSIVADPGGGYVLTWIERPEGGAARLAYATLDADGAVARRGVIAEGRDWFVNWADFPSLAILDNGDWVSFVLRKSDPAAPYAYDIWTTRSRDQGRSWSALELLHDDGTRTEHGFVALLPDGGDRALAIWYDGRLGAGAMDHDAADGHGMEGRMTLRGAVLTRDAAPREALQLDDHTCSCCTTDALRTAQGPLVAYRDRTPEEVRDVGWIARVAGAWSAPGIVHADNWQIAGCPVNGPALALAGTRPVIAWPTFVDGSYRVRVARREGEGWSKPVELEAGAGVMGRVDAAGWGDDGALVSWLGGQGGQSVLRLARLDAALAEAERLDVATLPPGRMTGMPRMASHRDAAILVWTSPEVRGGKVRGVLLRAGGGDAADADASVVAPAWMDATERDAIERGLGYGMARAAEANALPGPKHVLELATPLALEPAQRDTIEALRARMQAEAVRIGRDVLAAEAALDAELARMRPDPARVVALSTAAGEARGRLRAVHLDAHVAAARVLTASQIERYMSLRRHTH